MVLFIKGGDISNTNLEQICKQMINIENNKAVYAIDGSRYRTEKNGNFNQYKYKHVEYNITVSMGTVLIYTNSSLNSQDMAYKLSDMMNTLTPPKASSGAIRDYPKVSSNAIYGSSQYTLVTKNSPTLYNNSTTADIYTQQAYYRKLTASPNIRHLYKQGNRFIWMIQVISPSLTYLKPVNYSTKHDPRHIESSEFLMLSLSTIIYDGINMFNVKSGVKQINYPSLSQYTAIKQNRVITEHVSISLQSGLDSELMKYYMPTLRSTVDYRYGIRPQEHEFIDINSVELRRINADKLWHVQLNEPFNYKTQEDLESNLEETGKPAFPNDVCFISRMPLYGLNYILKVKKSKVSDVLEENVSHIPISRELYHSIITIRKVNGLCLNDYINTISGYDVIETYVTQYDRTELEAINMIPNDKISSLTKDLLVCISKNGIVEKESLYTMDLDKKIIYIGLNHISDSMIKKYMNTCTILFPVITNF